MTTERKSAALQLNARPGRVKYTLAGRTVNGGDPIQLCFSGGWVTGVFEWSGEVSERPLFFYSIELESGGGVTRGSLEIPDRAVMRWPP